jgi:hypothetical protein
LCSRRAANTAPLTQPHVSMRVRLYHLHIPVKERFEPLGPTPLRDSR